MKSQLLVTAIGEDRPGIVARLTEVFVKHKGNVEESRMALLGGEFAAIVLITIPSENIEPLKEELRSLEGETINVSVKQTSRTDPNRFAGHSKYEILLSGADHEGIVHKVAAYFSERNVNIHCVSTEVKSAPMSATPLFSMRSIVMVPQRISQTALQQDLAKIGDEENVEIIVKPHVEGTEDAVLSCKN